MKFLSEGLLIRGGVAYGDVYYDENKNMFFGDAINKACQYESKIAKYPRIVIDKYVAEEVIKYTNLIDICSKHNKNNISSILYKHVGCIVSLDLDKQYYLNYFNSIQQGRDYSLIIKKSNNQFIKDILSMCDEQIAFYKENKNVRSKYKWLKSYAQQSMNENIGKKVVYLKPLYDKIFDQTSEKNFFEALPNTAEPLDEAVQKGILKFLKTSETLNKYNI